MAEDSRFADERTIQEFWAGIGETNNVNQGMSRLPWFIGGPIYFLIYILRGINIFSAIRYTLTNRRIRVDRGMKKTTVLSIPLDDIEDIRLVDELAFTRTGNLEVIISGGNVGLTMAGIQDPTPTRLTIMDAVRARKQVQDVLQQQSRARATAKA